MLQYCTHYNAQQMPTTLNDLCKVRAVSSTINSKKNKNNNNGVWYIYTDTQALSDVAEKSHQQDSSRTTQLVGGEA